MKQIFQIQTSIYRIIHCRCKKYLKKILQSVYTRQLLVKSCVLFLKVLSSTNISLRKYLYLFFITIIGFEDVLVYCPKKQGCNLVPLRPIRHEVRYHLIIEATINNYLYRTITVRSPLLVKYAIFLCISL